MLANERQRRQGAGGAPVQRGAEVTQVVRARPPRTQGPSSRRQVYLERSSLIDIAERPVIVTARAATGEQTQIVRRPTRPTPAKARLMGRRGRWILGGVAATAMLLGTWFGLEHRAGTNGAAPPMPRGEPRGASGTSGVASSLRPIVAPITGPGSTPAAVSPDAFVSPAPASVRQPAAPETAKTSSKTSKMMVKAAGVKARSSRTSKVARVTVAERPAARARLARRTRLISAIPARRASTGRAVAWVDPFVDR